MAVREIDETIAGQASFERANLRPERTGLPFVVFISQKSGARQDVRVKLSRAVRVRPAEMITVAVRPRPRIIQGDLSDYEFDLVRQWLEMYQAILIDYWNGVIEYTEDVLAALQPISNKPQN